MTTYRKKPIMQIKEQILSSAALSDTYTMQADGFFYWAGWQADGSVTETATVEFISVDGSTYDIIFNTTNVTGTSYLFNPGKKIFLRKGDGIKITCSKATATETVRSTICVQEIETYE